MPEEQRTRDPWLRKLAVVPSACIMTPPGYDEVKLSKGSCGEPRPVKAAPSQTGVETHAPQKHSEREEVCHPSYAPAENWHGRIMYFQLPTNGKFIRDACVGDALSLQPPIS